MKKKSFIHWKLLFIFCLPIFLTANRCADESNESDENDFYKSEGLDEYRYAKPAADKTTAIEDWEQFLKIAQDKIADSRSNLEAFRFKMEAADGSEKLDMMKRYENAVKSVDALERKKMQRNDAFSKELEHYEPASAQKNFAFSKQFLTDLHRLNAALGSTIEPN